MSRTSYSKSIETIVLATIMAACGGNMERRDAMVDASTTDAATWTEVYQAMNTAHCPWCHTALNGGVGGTGVIGGGIWTWTARTARTSVLWACGRKVVRAARPV